MGTTYTDSSGYDHVAQTYFCSGLCSEAIEIRNEPVKDHTLCLWRHYGFISYPEVIATDEKGFTLEGVVAQPARKVLAHIPVQPRVQFCIDCWPNYRLDGCGYCGEFVDLNLEHSELECLDKYIHGNNGNLRKHYFHLACLPEIFSEVREYLKRYS